MSRAGLREPRMTNFIHFLRDRKAGKVRQIETARTTLQVVTPHPRVPQQPAGSAGMIRTLLSFFLFSLFSSFNPIHDDRDH